MAIRTHVTAAAVVVALAWAPGPVEPSGPGDLPRPVGLPGGGGGPHLVVVLEDPPLWDLAVSPSTPGPQSPREAAALAAAEDALAREQERVSSEVRRLGGNVLRRYNTVLNGMLVAPPPGGRRALADIAGVRAVYAAPLVSMALDDSVPFVGADRVWSQLGVDGAGVTVAVVDSGVDYYHGALGGPGDEAAYAADDPTAVEEGTFPTAKVTAGWDFAGSLYDPGCPVPDEVAGVCTTTPRPDPDPRDELGHGTQVAAVAAGSGSGAVHPGVAPGSAIVALKIFGRASSSDLLTDALEWVARSRMGLTVPGGPATVDVVNLSVGAPYAWGLLEAEGVLRRVTETGAVVVAAAGNAGDHPMALGSPAAAPEALAVAASFGPGEETLGLLARWQDGGVGGATERTIEAVEAAFTAPLVEVGPVAAAAAWMGTGCEGDTVPQPPRDRVALMERGQCAPVEKLRRAADLGARAVVVFTDDRPVEVMGGPEAAALPGVMIARGDGVAVRDLLQAGVVVTLTMDAQRRVGHPELADAIWPSSSRGPARGAGLKPELTAPGATISSARIGGGDGAIPGAGTSLAAPHVAGAAALLLAAAEEAGRPRPAPKDVARALVASTAATVFTDAQSEAAAPVARAGAGRLDVWAAAQTRTTLAAPALAGLDFGHRVVTDDLSAMLPLTIHNLEAAERYYRLTLRPRTNAQGAIRVTSSPAGLVSVPGGETVTLEVLLTADAEALARGPGLPRGGRGVGSGARLAEVEYDGRVELEEVAADGAPIPAGDRLHVPYYVLPEAASLIDAPDDRLVLVAQGSLGAASVPLANSGPADGVAEAFTWVGDDPAEGTMSPKVDVRHVGVRRGRDAAGEAILEFAVTFAGPYDVPPEVAVLVYLDVDLRGGLDWLVVGVDAEHLATGEFSGQWLTLAVPYPEGAAVPDWSRAVPQYYGDVRLGGAYVVLPVSLATLGMPAEGSRFQFFVSTEDRLWAGAHPERGDVAPGGVGLQAPVAQWLYDAARPRYEVWPWTSRVPAGGGARLRVASRARPSSPAAPGVLLVYPGNRQSAPEAAAQTLRVAPGDLGGPGWPVWLPRVLRGQGP